MCVAALLNPSTSAFAFPGVPPLCLKIEVLAPKIRRDGASRMRVRKWQAYLSALLLVVAVLAALEVLATPLGSDLGSLRLAALVAFVLVVLLAEIHRRVSNR